MTEKHWSRVEYLHLTVSNPNIVINGTHSYYSDCWDNGFEKSVVRYLHGDAESLGWEPLGKVDKLIIGDYVCIAAECVILMGGNHNHRTDFINLYPYLETINSSYQPRGDTILHDACWLGMRCMIMPGVNVGEGAVIAAGSVVTKNVAPYAIVGGNPARLIRYRFSQDWISAILKLDIYSRPDEIKEQAINLLSSNNLDALEKMLNG